jgi:hypothetical protein
VHLGLGETVAALLDEFRADDPDDDQRGWAALDGLADLLTDNFGLYAGIRGWFPWSRAL